MDTEIQIEAIGAIPIVDGKVFVDAIWYKVGASTIAICYYDEKMNEKTEEFSIRSAKLSGFKAN